MENFHVLRSTKDTKYSWCPFEIQCMWPTSMWPVSPRSSSNFLDFISADEVKYAITLDKTVVTSEICFIL